MERRGRELDSKEFVEKAVDIEAKAGLQPVYNPLQRGTRAAHMTAAQVPDPKWSAPQRFNNAEIFEKDC